MPAFNKHLGGRWRRRSHRRGSAFRVPWGRGRNGSGRGERARFSPPGCGAQRRAGSAPCPPPAPCLRAPSAGRRGSRADLSAGGTLPSPAPRLAGVCVVARPRTLSFHPRLPLPFPPRVAGGSSAHPCGSSAPGRRALGGRRAAGDRLKAPTSQPLLDLSSGDRSGQPERVKERGFVSSEKREKWGEDGGGGQERSDGEEY